MKLISQPAGGARETRVESSKWKRVHHLGSMNELSSFNVKFFKCSLKVTRIKSDFEYLPWSSCRSERPKKHLKNKINDSRVQKSPEEYV